MTVPWKSVAERPEKTIPSEDVKKRPNLAISILVYGSMITYSRHWNVTVYHPQTYLSIKFMFSITMAFITLKHRNIF